jgi:hypothetical protein
MCVIIQLIHRETHDEEALSSGLEKWMSGISGCTISVSSLGR